MPIINYIWIIFDVASFYFKFLFYCATYFSNERVKTEQTWMYCTIRSMSLSFSSLFLCSLSIVYAIAVTTGSPSSRYMSQTRRHKLNGIWKKKNETNCDGHYLFICHPLTRSMNITKNHFNEYRIESRLYLSKCFFSFGINLAMMTSWWARNRVSFGKPSMYRPCMAYRLSARIVLSAQNASSSFMYINRTPATPDIPWQ